MLYLPFPAYGPAGQPDPSRRWRINRDSPLAAGLVALYDAATGWDYVLNKQLSAFNFNGSAVSGARSVKRVVSDSGLLTHVSSNSLAGWYPAWAKWSESGNSFGPLQSLAGTTTLTVASLCYIPPGRSYISTDMTGFVSVGTGLVHAYSTPTPAFRYQLTGGSANAVVGNREFPLGVTNSHVLSIDTRAGSDTIAGYMNASKYAEVLNTAALGGLSFGGAPGYAGAYIWDGSLTPLVLFSRKAWKQTDVELFAREKWRAILEPQRQWLRAGGASETGLFLNPAGGLQRAGLGKRLYLQPNGTLVASATKVTGARAVQQAGNGTLQAPTAL